MTATRHAAVDLGASSGRVVVVEVAGARLEVREVHRFVNRPVRLPTGLHWDVVGLYSGALEGLQSAGPVDTVGVDSWAVDYALLDEAGDLLGVPHHYRDERTAAVIDSVHQRLPPDRLYSENGLQFLPFTTIYQLAAHPPHQLARAATLLLIPDLLVHWLTRTVGAEATNASTTGLLDPRTRQWNLPLAEALDLPARLFPPLRQPGEIVGPLLPEVRAQTGLSRSVLVVSVGSHDTASAVVATPMHRAAAFISLGTWGLVGVELDAPVLTAASRAANFTNELGVDDRVRYLRNVMGLWLLQESLRAWDRTDLPDLLTAARQRPRGPTFDVDDPRLLAPGDLPARIAALIVESGAPPPTDAVALVRAVVDSLAVALARTVHEAAGLSGRTVEVVHVVGGGAQNALLCQLVADRVGLPVVAGPVEATAIGNALVQARSYGTLAGDLDELRLLVAQTQPLRRFEPRP